MTSTRSAAARCWPFIVLLAATASAADVVPGLGHYAGTTANQITSTSWEAWPVAFTVERVKSLPGLDTP